MQKEGTVVQVFGLYYTVDDGENRIDCFLRGKNRLNKSNKKYSNPVAVGDKVLFTVHGSDHREGSIVSVLPRMNLFSRKDSKKNTREDVIAANIDQVLIIQSFSQPQPNLRFVDRLAVRSLHEGIKPVLCVNKSDMASGNDLQDIYDYYTNSGLDIFITSAKNGQGLEALHEVMDNRRTLLAGSSGVGKTSLLNAMYQTLHLRTAAVSDKTGKGRHTTTNVVMYTVGDTQLIDSPGVREFGMVELDEPEVRSYFYEFGTYAAECAFSDCTHYHEPDCAVKRAVEKGEISDERYVSYCNILLSVIEARENMYR